MYVLFNCLMYTLYTVVMYTEILQSYSQFKLECNAFMSKSNQQRMYKTKYVIFYNLLHSDICHNTEKQNYVASSISSRL